MPGRNWTRKSIEEMIDAFLKKRLKGGGAGDGAGDLGGALEVQYSLDLSGELGSIRTLGQTFNLAPFIGEILINKYPDITRANTIINKYHSPNNVIKTLINEYIKRTSDKALPLHDITSVHHDLLTDDPGAPGIITFGTFVDGLIYHPDEEREDYRYHNIWYDYLMGKKNSPNREYMPWIEKYIRFLPDEELFPEGNPKANAANGYTMAYTDSFYPTHNRHEEGRIWEGPYYDSTNVHTATRSDHIKTSDLWDSYNGTLRVVNVYCGFKNNDTKLYRLEWRDTNGAKYPLSPTVGRYGPFPIRPGGNVDIQAGVYNYTSQIEELTLYTDEAGHWPYPEGQRFRHYDGFAKLNGVINGLRMNDQEYLLRRRDIVKNPLYYYMRCEPTKSWYIDKMGDGNSVIAYYLMLSEPYQVERVEDTYIYTSRFSEKEILDIYNYVFNRRLNTFNVPDPQVIKYKTEIENRILTLGNLEDQSSWWL